MSVLTGQVCSVRFGKIIFLTLTTCAMSNKLNRLHWYKNITLTRLQQSVYVSLGAMVSRDEK